MGMVELKGGEVGMERLGSAALLVATPAQDLCREREVMGGGGELLGSYWRPMGGVWEAEGSYWVASGRHRLLGYASDI